MTMGKRLFRRHAVFHALGSEPRSILMRAYGRGWPLALLRALVRARRLFRRTRWWRRGDVESRCVRSLALWPALYLDLRDRRPARADQAMRDLMAAALRAETEDVARHARLSAIDDPAHRWHVFYDRGFLRGFGAFNESECLAVDADRFHVRVRRCLVTELACDAGVPELAQMFCDQRARLCRKIVPSYTFHAGAPSGTSPSERGTTCDYVWERDDAAETSCRAQGCGESGRRGRGGSAGERGPDDVASVSRDGGNEEHSNGNGGSTRCA